MLNGKWQALMIAPLLALPGAVQAGQAKPDAPNSITVQAAAMSVAHWSDRVAKSLDVGLTYPKPLGRGDYHEGLSRISFHCSDSGAPSDVTVASSSGSRDLDKAAADAVRQIPTLHPLPDGISRDQTFQAWVVFASDQDRLSNMLRTVRHDAMVANNAAAAQHASQTASNLPTVIVAAP